MHPAKQALHAAMQTWYINLMAQSTKFKVGVKLQALLQACQQSKAHAVATPKGMREPDAAHPLACTKMAP